MILAIIFASIIVADDMDGVENKRAFTGAAAVALFSASLVLLKTTFVLFATTYLVVSDRFRNGVALRP